MYSALDETTWSTPWGRIGGGRRRKAATWSTLEAHYAGKMMMTVTFDSMTEGHATLLHLPLNEGATVIAPAPTSLVMTMLMPVESRMRHCVVAVGAGAAGPRGPPSARTWIVPLVPWSLNVHRPT